MIDSQGLSCQIRSLLPTMDPIRFQCPACSVALTVPPAAAGFRGPCPKCSAEIIGPNPALGLPARLPEITPAPASTFDPFPDKLIPVAPRQQPSPEPIPPTDPFTGPSQTSQLPPAPQPAPPVSPPSPEPVTVLKPVSEPVPPKDEKKGKPFEDFAPPTAQKAPLNLPPVATASSTPQGGGSRALVIVLSCLLCATLAFVAGFSTGRRIPDQANPIHWPKQAEPPVAQTEPIPIPVRTWIPDGPADVPTDVATDISPSAPGETPSVGPEATLKAFLNADSWAARSAYVMFPESIRERMEAHSQISDDGPIETTDVSLFEITEQAHIFTVATPKIPEGFPVAVSRDGNSWLVDWETFIEFHGDRFNRFATGKEGDHGVFHLLVKPANDDGNDALFNRYLLNPPMPGREQSAYIKKGTVALARLEGVFERQAGQNEEIFNKLIEGQGPPMVLALTYKVNSEGRSYLLIEDVIAIGWGPGTP